MIARRSRRHSPGIVLAALATLGFSSAAQAAIDCDAWLAQSPIVKDGLVSPEDLASVVDIGTADFGMGAPSPLAVSPDGQQVAFAISRADPGRNLYCRALMVADLRRGGALRRIDIGGDFFPMSMVLRGLITPQAVAEVVTPRWSPDGQRIAYLRRDEGVTQAWIAAADGSGAQRATTSLVDIERVGWAANGHDLVVALRSGLLEARAERQAEGLRGFLYDDRYVPMFGKAPQLRGPLPLEFAHVGADGGLTRIDTVEAGDIGPAPTVPDVMARVVNKYGAAASIRETLPGTLFSPATLSIESGDGRVSRCEATTCTGERFLGLWWADDNAVLYLRREGWAGRDIALYRWRPSEKPQRIYRSAGLLSGCILGGQRLICLAEAATRPRILVAINTRSGAVAQLYDPNPHFAEVSTVGVRRLYWQNALGLRAFGDLVLPPTYRRGQRLPLIVVQYEGRGFLRGGTGDEIPILPLAAAGFAVLRIQKPLAYASLFPGRFTNWDEAEAAHVKGWAERRSVADAVVEGVRVAVATGAIDESRIGLTGLSDGSTTAGYLLINTKLFAASSLSTCCADPQTDTLLGGLAWEAFREQSGYPPPAANDRDFWAPVSLALNAARVAGPILLQLADDEYIRGLEAYAAFRRVGPPSALYVFPDERHVKWQPAHRLAIYQRNIDWFSYWLLGRRNPNADAGQYALWDRLADQSRERGWTVPSFQAATQASASASRRSE